MLAVLPSPTPAQSHVFCRSATAVLFYCSSVPSIALESVRSLVLRSSPSARGHGPHPEPASVASPPFGTVGILPGVPGRGAECCER